MEKGDNVLVQFSGVGQSYKGEIYWVIKPNEIFKVQLENGKSVRVGINELKKI